MTVVLNHEEIKIYPAYVSKHNSNCEKQVILLMIPIVEKWHYLVVKKTISIIKKNNFQISLRFLLSELPNSFATDKKLELHKKLFEKKIFIM